MSMPDITMLAVIAYMPRTGEPVESVMRPSMYGLTKPPRLPIELMVAKPTAAAPPM